MIFCSLFELVLPGMRFTSDPYVSKYVEWVVWLFTCWLVNMELTPGFRKDERL